MYLQPDSNLLGGASQTGFVPQHLQHHLVTGFSSHFTKAKGLGLLTQYFEHAESTIYLHHIQATKGLRLIAKAASNRLVLGYLAKGNSSIYFPDGMSLSLRSPTMLFFKNLTGKEIHLELEAGGHEMICCCFKPSFEKQIFQWYPMLADLSLTPCHFHVSHWVHYQWCELWSNQVPVEIYAGFVAERIRTLLRFLATEILALEKNKNLHLLHSEIPVKVVEKAYGAQKIIDEKLGETLSLKKIAQLTRWNLQGLKQGFVQVFGISPHQYIIQQRMKIALNLVQHTEESIRVIALICGYKQAHHFIRQFKLSYGVTPGEMRRETTTISIVQK